MLKSFPIFSFLAVLGAAILSCSKPVEQEIEDAIIIYTMQLEGQVDGYDGVLAKSSTPTRADGSDAWKDGDKVNITFFVSDKIVQGAAQYNAGANNWTVAAYGKLSTGSNQSCELIYIEATPSNTNAVYQDLSATCSVSANNQIVVSAHLKPMTPRIRFVGNPTPTFYNPYTAGSNAVTRLFIQGLKTYVGLDRNGRNLIESDATIVLPIEDGSTQYLYGFLPEDESRIYLTYEGETFTRMCSKAVFKNGVSGYMNIPTTDTYKNWLRGFNLSVEGVEFTMLPESFDYYGNRNSYRSESYVTEALYYTVTTGVPNTSTAPAVIKSQAERDDFCSLLKQKFSMDFQCHEEYHGDNNYKYTLQCWFHLF